MSDEVFKSTMLSHIDEIAHRIEQPTDGIILARNAELRKNPGAIHDLGAQTEGGSYGRMLASIPMVLYEKALRDGYDLNNTNSEVSAAEMSRYLQSVEGRACLVQDSTQKYFKGN